MQRSPAVYVCRARTRDILDMASVIHRRQLRLPRSSTLWTRVVGTGLHVRRGSDVTEIVKRQTGSANGLSPRRPFWATQRPGRAEAMAAMASSFCARTEAHFNMFGGQLVLNGFKNNLMTDGSPFPSWSGCGRGLHKDRVGLMRPMATRQRHLVSPRAALAAASQSQHVPCTTKRASAITKPLATHVTRSSTCLFSS